MKKCFVEQGQGDFSAAELRGVEMCMLKRRMLLASHPWTRYLLIHGADSEIVSPGLESAGKSEAQGPCSRVLGAVPLMGASPSPSMRGKLRQPQNGSACRGLRTEWSWGSLPSPPPGTGMPASCRPSGIPGKPDF